DKNFDPQKKKLFNAIVEEYRQKGENDKAASLEAKLSGKTTPETPAERLTVELGKTTFDAGIANLKMISPPNSSFPSKDQTDEALEGLHKMSLISSGRERDESLETESIEELQTKLTAAEAALNVQRSNFDQACSTGNHGNIMPALTRKQEAMQEVLRLKS